jgi:predicted DNA-binding transcriptional regulator AlpA
MANQAALPPTLAPGVLSREGSAAYVSVSPVKFDEMVDNGTMPQPRKLVGSRIGWIVRELDVAIKALPYREPQRA